MNRDFRNDGFACFGCAIYAAVIAFCLATLIVAQFVNVRAIVNAADDYTIEMLNWDQEARNR